MAFIPLATGPTVRPARTRTPKQLQRKRSLDKASQKRKRDQQKAHAAGVEQDLWDARAEIEYLRAAIRDMQNGTEQAPRDADPAQPGPHAAHVLAPIRSAPEDRKPPHIDCYCLPKVHRNYSECFERTVFGGVMHMHRSPATIQPVPATPELADILFLREPWDPISSVLYKLVRRPNMNSMVIICAVYILAHRLLRVRHPPEATLRRS